MDDLKLSPFNQSQFVDIVIAVNMLFLYFPLDLNTCLVFSFLVTYFLLHNSQYIFSTPSCDQKACYEFSYLKISSNSTLNNTQIITLNLYIIFTYL